MSKKYIDALRDKRATRQYDASKILARGNLTKQENKQVADILNEVEDIDAQIVRAKNDHLDTRGVTGVRSPEDEAFTRFLRSGNTSGLKEVRADGTGFSTAPNDAGVSAGSTGNYAGYMVPQGFWDHLQVALKAYGGIANDFQRIDTDTGNPMPWPTIDPTAVTASVLGASNELTQLSVTDPYVFGQGMLNAWTVYVGPMLASLMLIQDSAFDVDHFVADRFGEAIGREIAALAISGTGSGQPLGIITALNARGAVTTSGGYCQLTAATDVNTLGGSVTELAGNVLSPQTLLNMIASVDPAYRNDPDGNPTAAFYVNDAQLKGLRTVVDQYGRPLLQKPNSGGAPTLWGYPVKVDNNIPNLTTSSTGGPIFGNLGPAMVMRVARDTTVMRLQERYADYLAVGYIGYYRLDCRSNDLRAAVTVKAAAT